MTPWQYLDDIIRTDRGPEHDEVWMTNRLQLRWPGNYHVEPYQMQTSGAPYISYHIVFDTPEDETWFVLKWR